MPRIVDADQRRDDITAAAARVIARAGIEAATMREVAAEAGWTTGVLTHYFADKRELLLATFEASLSKRRSLRPTTELMPPAERLRHSLEGALPLDDERRRHWMVTLACCSHAVGDPRLAAAQAAAYREFRDHITAQLSLMTAARGVAHVGGSDSNDGDARTMAERLIALADGIAVQALFDPSSWPPRRQLAALDTELAAVAPS
jgi:AcrR family transcriptional regulator